MKKKVILVLLDACRGDYINPENTPFMVELGKQGVYYKSLVPSFGFCERTEILVGKDSLDSGYFTAFGYDPEQSPYRGYSYIFKLLGFIENIISSGIFSKIIRRIIWEVFRFKDGTYYPARIPLSQLANFCFTEDGPLNLIDNSHLSLYKKSEKVYLQATTSLNRYLSGTDQTRLDDVLEALDQPYDFYPMYISLLDAVGHQYGPKSDDIKTSLRHVDDQLKDFYEKIELTQHSPTIVLCGDHGMSPVREYVDIESVIKRLKKQKHLLKNFNMFLDSTMARFWFKDHRADEVQVLQSAIKDDFGDQGYFVSRDNYISAGIPNLRIYGDLIWLCNEGVVISPDYFTPSDKPILGMHGYRPTDQQHYGFAIVNGDGVEPKVLDKPEPLTKIYGELKEHITSLNIID
tara:strand:- start:18293 stop:19504 length:1212 start_codon:yes stop_codon:yes gene_type:complete